MMFSLSSSVRVVSRADNKSRPDKQKNRTGILGIIDKEGGREGGERGGEGGGGRKGGRGEKCGP